MIQSIDQVGKRGAARARTIVGIHPGLRDDIADLQTRRPDVPLSQNDPFLLINHHGPQFYPPNNHGMPFEPHPHRGFETVTFVLHGELAHRDSAGHESVVDTGGVQWMTAGSGVFHDEAVSTSFANAGGTLELLQLWVNLPARLKMTTPAYHGARRAQIPYVALGGRATLHLISGAFEGRRGPIPSLTGTFMSTVTFEAGGRATLPVPPGRTLFLYVVEGRIAIDGQSIGATILVETDRAGDRIQIDAIAASTIVYGHADPIDENVVAMGPFVMNTMEEIAQAFADVQSGRISPGKLTR